MTTVYQIRPAETLRRVEIGLGSVSLLTLDTARPVHEWRNEVPEDES